MYRFVRIALAIFTWLAILPSAAYAQASITGLVRDTSGAVLPGVTVEASSPALIEKVRSVVTDGTGQYRIENLRPGAYTVTFTLPGFNTVKREGIELMGTFTATVSVDLRVGALEETITVTGETPIVDVQSTTQQQVLNREIISSLPSSRNAAFMASLIPAVTSGNQDVGGVGGESFSSSGGITVHGVGDVRTNVNGVSVHSAQGNGSTGVGNIAAFEEMVVDTSGVSVEHTEGGVQMNMIPRDGGNVFRGYFFSAFANNSMQGDNLTQELRDRGLAAPSSLKKYYDLNPALGGPIKRDKLWFHTTVRYNRALTNIPMFINKNSGKPNVWTYDPDVSAGPVASNATWKGFNGRVTWQATPKNKLALAYDIVNSCQCPRPSATETLEATGGSSAILFPKDMLFGDWTAPLTSRVLLEGALLKHREHADRPKTNAFFLQDPGVRMIGVQDQGKDLNYRADRGVSTDTWNKTVLTRFATSYITGAHALKVGMNYERDSQDQYRYSVDSPMSFRFNNGVPNQLTMQATPWRRAANLASHAIFAQDRWTVGRLTVTGGVRYDYFHSFFPVTTIGPGDFVPNRNLTLPKTDGVRWHDISPRSGAAYDLFGNGKTAVKVSFNKYLANYALPNSGGVFTNDLAPAARLITSTNRSWTDTNGNFVPDCDLLLPGANGECGGMSNIDFGSTRPGRAYDPDTLTGWGKREFNWQFSAGVQREIVPRMSVDVSYFRTWFGNFIVTDDRAVGPTDFDRFSIVAPTDSRLPGGGGYEVAGLYDLKPAVFGRPTDDYLTFAKNFGKQMKHWNGVDLTVTARPRADLTFQGGTSTGRTSTDNCEIAAKLPERLFAALNVGEENANVWLPASFCHQDSKFLTQVKFFGTYTVPRIDVQVTGTMQSRPGPQIVANFVATNAVILPSLGRNLAGAARNITVNIVDPGTMYGERTNQIDLRFGKILRFGRTRATASVDLYNLMNSNAVRTQSNAFATWQQPQAILNPRFAKVVMQFDF